MSNETKQVTRSHQRSKVRLEVGQQVEIKFPRQPSKTELIFAKLIQIALLALPTNSTKLERLLDALRIAMFGLASRAQALAQAWTRPRPAGRRAVQRAEYLLDLLSTFVPKRIANEEVGDALELIQQLAKARRPAWFIRLKVVTTFFWVAVHTVLHYAHKTAAVIGIAKGSDDK